MRPEWRDTLLPDPGIPTMISAEERSYLHWLAGRTWTGQGHIVEIGPWLGGSTYCLASGMRHNTHRGDRRLHTFDDFEWREFMSSRADVSLQPGDCFLEEFRKNLGGFEDLLVVHRQVIPDDLPEWDVLFDRATETGLDTLTWHDDEPVEILFIDGAKSWGSMIHVLRELGELFLPGATLLVCQDYKYWGEYWTALLMEHLSDHVSLVHNLTWNTVTFRVTSPLSRDRIEALPALSQISIAEGLSRLDTAAARIGNTGDPLGALIMESTKIRFLAHRGERDAAREVFERLESRWPIGATDGNLEQAREGLARSAGIDLAPSMRTRTRSLGRAISAARRGRVRQSLRAARRSLWSRYVG
ncbi:MAG: class I SAM-dependent methyltransferase [Planctomycetota bacterium]